MSLHQEKKIVRGKELIGTYIQCPKCNERYFCYYDDKETIKLSEQMNKEARKVKNAKNEHLREKHYNMYIDKQNRLGQKRKNLQEKYSMEVK
jgi:thiol:disulfide interchange protein